MEGPQFFSFCLIFFDTIQCTAVTQSQHEETQCSTLGVFFLIFLKSCSVYQEHKIYFKHYSISEIERITQFENTPYGVSASALRRRDNIPPGLGVEHKREGSPTADGMEWIPAFFLKHRSLAEPFLRALGASYCRSIGNRKIDCCYLLPMNSLNCLLGSFCQCPKSDPDSQNGQN